MIVNDPIYKTIQIEDDDLIEIVKTKAFQRLSLIKQQGNTFFLHNEAIHTRFEHSLGIYELLKRVISSLSARGDIFLTHYEKKLAKVAALLHDIGHGPFSHCFQLISGHDHGELTLRIISENTEIRNIIDRTPNLLNDVLHILRGGSKYKIIEEILFGSLSLDQLDFWNRDLYYSHLHINPYDIDILIDSLRLKGNTLMIDVSAVPQIERMISMKESLYKYGFGHPFVVGKDLLIQEIFKTVVREDIHLQSQPLSNVLKSEMLQIEDFLSLHDKILVDEVIILSNVQEHEQLKKLATLYLSSTDSVKYDESYMDMYSSTGIVIKENKNYCSYTGGIYVSNGEEIVDILQVSKHIQNITEIPAKYRVYSLNGS
ncbi:HD domain-containing protein [Cytobacillus sp. IB215665]|uniref:HD domain-containing protein n=1 Tax=Cytobacillus sp. IB215665 TaxID=3097357 RepID=UPI002A13C33A|nr:HD domain-containing protein [Cytobacillus sp. IB215665]MDX8366744.1 HD domain-containing protein [Cytobacillus sp. IB215665]